MNIKIIISKIGLDIPSICDVIRQIQISCGCIKYICIVGNCPFETISHLRRNLEIYHIETDYKKSCDEEKYFEIEIFPNGTINFRDMIFTNFKDFYCAWTRDINIEIDKYDWSINKCKEKK